MMYYAYDWQRAMLAPLRAWAANGMTLADEMKPLSPGSAWSHFNAACRLVAETRITHERPAFGIDHVEINGRRVPVIEEVAASTPFCTLLRFRQAGAPPQPRVLVSAPLSGHFATLLQATVKSLARDHEVYVTDWHNMRDVPLSAGPFGLDDYVDHLIRFQAVLGPGGHMLAVCQPCVPALAAVAVMAEKQDPSAPRSLTLMAGTDRHAGQSDQGQ